MRRARFTDYYPCFVSQRVNGLSGIILFFFPVKLPRQSSIPVNEMIVNLTSSYTLRFVGICSTSVCVVSRYTFLCAAVREKVARTSSLIKLIIQRRMAHVTSGESEIIWPECKSPQALTLVIPPSRHLIRPRVSQRDSNVKFLS